MGAAERLRRRGRLDTRARHRGAACAPISSPLYIDNSRGRAVETGTDIKVSASDVEHLGMTLYEVVDAHPHLTLAAVH
jgi:hypothetical protein